MSVPALLWDVKRRVRNGPANGRQPPGGVRPSIIRNVTARWDGNVRELKNVIERACMLADANIISERELTGALGQDTAGRVRAPVAPAPGSSAAQPAALEQVERDHIIDVLKQVDGNRVAAARLLGISRRALYRRLDRHHITAG